MRDWRKLYPLNYPLPPIEGLPEVRPACLVCGTPLKPLILNYDVKERRHVSRDTRYPGTVSYVIVRRRFVKWIGHADKFDLLRCALKFAVSAYDAGYRFHAKK